MAIADQLDFVQVSDCHVARVLTNDEYPSLASTIVGSGNAQPGHDIALCKAFTLALEDVKVFSEIPPASPVAVVMSGDLTASGDPREFAVGHSFFRSQWRLRREDISEFEQQTGLALSNEHFAAIPGNHDNWFGRGWSKSPAYNPSLYPDHFRPTPWTKTWTGRQGILRLHLCGLDSNSGLTGSNRRARGAIAPVQLTHLSVPPAAVNGTVSPVTVKAVVCHHSLAYTAPRGQRGSLELEGASRQALLDAAATHGYVAVLTGHTHDPFQYAFQVTVGGTTRQVHELRCSTTLQGPPEDGKQGFLLHRIHPSDEGNYVWSTWKYVWFDGAFIREDEAVRWPPFPVA